jgi:hypothetical protein
VVVVRVLVERTLQVPVALQELVLSPARLVLPQAPLQRQPTAPTQPP